MIGIGGGIDWPDLGRIVPDIAPVTVSGRPCRGIEPLLGVPLAGTLFGADEILAGTFVTPPVDILDGATGGGDVFGGASASGCDDNVETGEAVEEKSGCDCAGSVEAVNVDA